MGQGHRLSNSFKPLVRCICGVDLNMLAQTLGKICHTQPLRSKGTVHLENTGQGQGQHGLLSGWIIIVAYLKLYISQYRNPCDMVVCVGQREDTTSYRAANWGENQVYCCSMVMRWSSNTLLEVKVVAQVQNIVVIWGQIEVASKHNV